MPVTSQNHLQSDLKLQNDLPIATNCEDCKKIDPQTGTKLCINCTKNLKENKKERQSLKKSVNHGASSKQIITKPISQLNTDYNQDPQQAVDKLSGTDKFIIQEKSESQKHNPDIKNGSDQSTGIINQSLDDAIINQHNINNVERTGSYNKEKFLESQKYIKNEDTSKCSLPKLEKSTKTSKTPSSLKDAYLNGVQLKKELTKNDPKDNFDIILVAESSKYGIDPFIPKSNNIVEGIYIENTLSQNQDDNNSFILKNLYVDLKGLASESDFNSGNKDSNKTIKLNNLNEQINEFLFNLKDYAIDINKMNKLSEPFKNSIIHMKEEFFIKKNILVGKSAELRKDQTNTKNIYIIKNKNGALLLLKSNKKDYYSVYQYLLKYFNEKISDFEFEGIDNKKRDEIISIFAGKINYMFNFIIKKFNAIYNLSNIEFTEQDNKSIRYFLFLFYEINFDQFSKFNCVLKIENKGA